MGSELRFSQHLQQALENADRGISKITREILLMDGMTGTKTRHFYNNLLNIEDARYLEVGTWKGSSVCAAMCGNSAKILCIDNWSEFNGPKDDFLINFNRHKGNNEAYFIESDCFNVDITHFPRFNIYMYDGNHTKEAHYRALMHYYNCLEDVFIFVVDDWNWKDVREGTREAIKALKLSVLFEREIFTAANCVYDTWWNGIFVAILQKSG